MEMCLYVGGWSRRVLGNLFIFPVSTDEGKLSKLDIPH